MKCPGQDSRYWESAAIFEVQCPNCRTPIEFFKDDSSRTCRACGSRMLNPKIDFGCAAYCPYAAQCLGALPEGLTSSAGQTLKERTAIEMKRCFGKDFKGIGHAVKVAQYAETIIRSEPGDPAVILIGAYLHGLGASEPAAKGLSSTAAHPHPAATSPAREILTRLQADAALITAVCGLIDLQQCTQTEKTTNFKVFHDADLIAHLEEGQKESPLAPEQLAEMIEHSFFTETGRRVAAEVLVRTAKHLQTTDLSSYKKEQPL
ncbi:MAG: phosphohydrolase [Deltaproteobacteria bacterium]|nr:phosphohydrolase [Deltaproteobacteria bacterium]